MPIDTLSQALSNILNAEKVGKSECTIKVVSKVITKVLDIMKAHDYIKEYEYLNDNKGGVMKVKLAGTINNCSVIKPRFSFTNKTLEKYEQRYLPAKDLGLIIVSTSKGLMTQAEAREKKIGGKLISFVY